MSTSRNPQSGMTLIEVMVAFAIFALCAGTLYQTLGASLQREQKGTFQRYAGLVAESILDQQRVMPAPWALERTGQISDKLSWTLRSRPYAPLASTTHVWNAYVVDVSVTDPHRPSRVVSLESVELLRDAP